MALIYKDRYNRPLEALRLIITQRCNFRCTFCHREGDFYNSRSELMPEHYSVLARAAQDLGVMEYKITGGEPLIREDVEEIIEAVRPYSRKVSLTTNGSLLKGRATRLAESGLHHINVSLFTLNESKFREVTGGSLGAVLEGIDASIDAGLRTKINTVILSENLNEIDAILDFASSKGLDVNIIQLMPVFYFERDPVKMAELYKKLNGDVWLIEERLREMALRVELRQPHNRTAYIMPSGIEVDVIKGFSNPFACITCTRMRVTHDGLVKLCLYMEKPAVDLRRCLEAGDESCVKQKLSEALSLREPGFKLPIQTSYTLNVTGGGRTLHG